MQISEQWFNLAALGFEGWEHGQTFEVTTDGTQNVLCTEVRKTGSSFTYRVFAPKGKLYTAIGALIESI